MSATNSIRECFLVPCKIFYCNGMTTSREAAQAHADEIQALTQCEVELHHNNSTSTGTTVAMGAKIGAGAVLTTYAVASEKKTTERKVVDAGLGILGLFLVGVGLYDYCEIQNEKNESARELARKVISYLQQHPLGDVTLIFHSQGADIGHRALDLLNLYKNRIHVVTIGGMIDIPDSFANRVVNFVDDSDLIAHVAKATFGQLSIKSYSDTHTKVAIKNGQCKTSLCHGSTDYLKHPHVKSTLAKFSKPKAYN